jgi:hypothetical protein
MCREHFMRFLGICALAVGALSVGMIGAAPAAADVGARPTFIIAAVQNADWYQIQIDEDWTFGSPAVDQMFQGTTFTPALDLTPGATYYWRVRARNPSGTWGIWSVGRSFIVASSNSGSVEFTLSTPAEGDRVTLPLHLAGYMRTPGNAPLTLSARLTYAGQTISGDFNTLQWGNLQVFIYSLDDMGVFASRPPTSTLAVLEVFSHATNQLLLSRSLTLLGQDQVMTVPVYFLAGGTQPTPVQRQLPPTLDVGRAVLEELFWGPTPREVASGLSSAIPDPPRTQSYTGGRGASVLIHVPEDGLAISDNVATLALPDPVQAAAWPDLAAEQIRRTLIQFDPVEIVNVLVNGVPWP